jgi:hypothetical protein
MATKKEKKSKARKLKLSKETLKDLTARDARVKGGTYGVLRGNNNSF